VEAGKQVIARVTLYNKIKKYGFGRQGRAEPRALAAAP